MCRRTTCPTCQKPSWTGCGAHVEQVLGDVAVKDRCACSGGTESSKTSFLSRIFRGG